MLARPESRFALYSPEICTEVDSVKTLSDVIEVIAKPLPYLAHYPANDCSNLMPRDIDAGTLRTVNRAHLAVRGTVPRDL